jgi:hypothetical protein
VLEEVMTRIEASNCDTENRNHCTASPLERYGIIYIYILKKGERERDHASAPRNYDIAQF